MTVKPLYLIIFIFVFSSIAVSDSDWVRPNAEVNQNNTISYGELYYHNDATPLVITMPNPDIYYNITGLTIGEYTNINITTNNITIISDGTYKITVSSSFNSVAASKNYELAIFNNDVEVLGCEIHRKIGTGNDIGAVSTTCIINLYTGDIIDVRAECETTPSANLNIETINFNVVKIINQGDSIDSDYFVPYNGAIQSVNLGNNNLSTNKLYVGDPAESHDYLANFYENVSNIIRVHIHNPNKNLGYVVGSTLQLYGDLGYASLGYTNSGSTIKGGLFSGAMNLYNQGYGDSLFVVDGAEDFIFYTDPTDSHNYGAFDNEVMRLSTNGNLSLSHGNIQTPGNVTITGLRSQLLPNLWVCQLTETSDPVITSNLTRSINEGDC